MLAGWSASTARFREDANAEQDAATGGYHDRLVVELAQNAVDAATAAGVEGRLLLQLTGNQLLAANTGAPLDAAGVSALSTLRASAKRAGDTVGRFGVGFAAVLGVSEEPAIGSRGRPSVRWSPSRTAALVAELPSLAAEVAARDGHVPVLRLPFDGEELAVPAGYDTVVALPLRDRTACLALLHDVDPTLPLVLPGLATITVEVDGVITRHVSCSWDGSGALLDGQRWLSVTASGAVEPSLLADRPAEERGGQWSVRALAPQDGNWPLQATVLRAPTPTDEPLSLPVLLSCSVPVDPTRRRIVRGRLADYVLGQAGRAVAKLAPLVDDPFPLVPTGLAAGDVDAAVRQALAADLPEVQLFAGRRARDCSVLDLGAASEGVAELLDLDGLLPAVWASPARAAAARLLGVRRLSTAEVVELFAGTHRSPTGWRAVYAALADAPDREALGALPVPLADGRVVTGARGALLPAGRLPPEVAALPLRLVHPDAAHPLLERLGAVPATAAGLLADPALLEALDDPEAVRAVAALVGEAGVGTDGLPWLATVPLPGESGDRQPAGDLLWPGGLMDRAGADLDRLAVPAWLDHDTAVALGVIDGPALLRAYDVPVEPAAHPEPGAEPAILDLDGAEEWLGRCAGAGPMADLAEVVALRDLDTVGDLGILLSGIAADRSLRAAVVTAPAPGAPSYTAWWLSRQRVFDGRTPPECALPGAEGLSGLYAEAPALDAELLRALGVRTGLDDVLADAEATGDLLDRLGDSERSVGRAQARAAYTRAAVAWADRLEQAPEPPLAVRAVGADGAPGCVPAERAVVVDAPDLLSWVLGAGHSVLPTPMSVAPGLAALLDLPLASELDVPAVSGGRSTPVPQGLLDVVGSGPDTYRLHAELGAPWRWVGGELHATAAGLPHGLAWASGRWELRHVLAALVADPAAAPLVLLAADLDG